MLRNELKKIKFPVHGRKAELIERLKSDEAQKKKNGITKECQIVLRPISNDTSRAVVVEEQNHVSSTKISCLVIIQYHRDIQVPYMPLCYDKFHLFLTSNPFQSGELFSQYSALM